MWALHRVILKVYGRVRPWQSEVGSRLCFLGLTGASAVGGLLLMSTEREQLHPGGAASGAAVDEGAEWLLAPGDEEGKAVNPSLVGSTQLP